MGRSRPNSLFLVILITLILTSGLRNAFALCSSGFSFPVGGTSDHSGWDIRLELGESWNGYYGHPGEDFLIDFGSALGKPVSAASDGIVHFVYAGSPQSWGGVVIIKHTAPTGSNFNISGCALQGDPGDSNTSTLVVYTLYGHLENISVSKGQIVLYMPS